MSSLDFTYTLMSIDIYFNLQDFLQMLIKTKNLTNDVVAGTTEKLQRKSLIPIIFSSSRGVDR